MIEGFICKCTCLGKSSSTGYLFVCAMLFRYMTLALCLRFVRKGVWLVQIGMGFG